jgi:lysozyme family protein
MKGFSENVTLLWNRHEIRTAWMSIRRKSNKKLLQELDYRIDICRVTKGAHIEHL